jgi:hypothetical protein
MAAISGPNAIYSFVFATDSGDSWGGWFVAAAGSFTAGARLRTEGGAYTVLTQVADGFDGSLFGLQEGQIFVEWYRSGQTEQFLPTRNGPGLAAGVGGLGSELDQAWTGADWTTFGEGGRHQARLPPGGADTRFTWIFEALSGDRWGGLLFDAGATWRPGDTYQTADGIYRILEEASVPAGSGMAPGTVQIIGGYYDSAGGRELPIQRATSGVDGPTGLGSEMAAAWTGTAFVPFGLGGTVQADGPSARLVTGAFRSDLGTWTNQERLPRSLADMDGDGRADVVGFGNAGVWVARSGAAGFEPPRLALDSFGAEAGGWASQDRFPRVLADIDGDGRSDVVGFGNAGIWVARSDAAGGFEAPRLALADFGFTAGGWTSQDRFPRVMADVNGDVRADLVAFGYAGMQVALADANGGFGAPRLVLRDFAVGAGGWASQDRFPRMMADVNGDGRADLVAFGYAGMQVALADGDGGFGAPRLVLRDFAVGAGGWTSQDRFPRMMADVNGDGRADLIAFGFAGVQVALADADGGFAAPRLVLADFAVGAGGWASQDQFPRMAADMNGDGRADLIGFGALGVSVALADASGGVGTPDLALSEFGWTTGGWTSQEPFPRMLADVDGDGRADLVGFGRQGMVTALANGADGFDAPRLALPDFGFEAGGWTSQDRFPRMMADVNGDGRADLVAFGFAGMQVALADATGGFGAPRLVLRDFAVGAGGWTSQDRFPRMMADVNGDGRADLVAFGYAGMQVALADATGGFGAPRLVLRDFAVGAGGWASQDRFPRMMADVNGDGRADVVGFGVRGVSVALADASGGFEAPRLLSGEFGQDSGWSSQDLSPRMVADVNGDGRADVVGFRPQGVWVDTHLWLG